MFFSSLTENFRIILKEEWFLPIGKCILIWGRRAFIIYHFASTVTSCSPTFIILGLLNISYFSWIIKSIELEFSSHCVWTGWFPYVSITYLIIVWVIVFKHWLYIRLELDYVISDILLIGKSLLSKGHSEFICLIIKLPIISIIEIWGRYIFYTALVIRVIDRHLIRNLQIKLILVCFHLWKLKLVLRRRLKLIVELLFLI